MREPGLLDKQHRMGPLDSLDSRHLEPPDHQLSPRSMDRQSPASHQLRLCHISEPTNNETHRLEEGRTFTTAERQPRENNEM